MGSSTKKKQTRQPAKLLKAGESQSGIVTAKPPQLVVPLVKIRDKAFAQAKEGDRVQVFDRDSHLDAVVAGSVLGEIAPHYERPVRRFGLNRGVISSIDRDSTTVTVLLAS